MYDRLVRSLLTAVCTGSVVHSAVCTVVLFVAVPVGTFYLEFYVAVWSILNSVLLIGPYSFGGQKFWTTIILSLETRR